MLSHGSFVEFWLVLTLRLRQSRCIRTQCSGEILCAAADRLSFPQSARVIGVGCCSCTVAVTGLLSAVVVGVSLIPGGQRIAVGIIGIGDAVLARGFACQPAQSVIDIGGGDRVAADRQRIAACKMHYQ